jgi:hypothetical protein
MMLGKNTFSSNNSLAVAATYSNIGVVMYIKGGTDGALDWYQRARVIREEKAPIPW